MKHYRNAIVKQAKEWIGRKESNGTHIEIIDVYNAHKPLARGYKVKYTDAWCSTFASAVAIEVGYTDIIPTECGCGKHIELFKKMGIWEEKDSHIPSPGDYIFYDWEDDGKGDNTGGANHVGIVEKVENGVITVIEGNYKNAVGRRTIKVNGKYIRGFGVPKYDDEPTTTTPTTTATSEIVYTVKKGDTLSGIAKKYNTTYQKLAEYNNISNPNKISVGQKIKILGAKEPITYTVKKGDTLSSIAKKYNTTYQKIAKDNNISNPNKINVGQKLIIK
jgi:LysM repeat protein